MFNLSLKATGRLAPSPTGLLHFGNLWSLLLAWLAARASKGAVILRIEDLDPARSKPEYVQALIEDLLWLGLDWDRGPVTSQANDYFQSQRHNLYADALHTLTQQGLTYPCFCRRKDLKALPSAPHSEDVGTIYPGTCRTLTCAQRTQKLAQGLRPCVRFACPENSAPIVFRDVIQGVQSYNSPDWGGDFALQRSDGVYAYQLACAVDDALMGVTQVVRGRDLLSSTPRQILLLNFLDLVAPKQYAHVPLLLAENGERLAKRHQSLTLRAVKEKGAQPGQIIGLLAYLAGLNPRKQLLSPYDLVPVFCEVKLQGPDICITNALLNDFALICA